MAHYVIIMVMIMMFLDSNFFFIKDVDVLCVILIHPQN
jgi:hypothetical protein